MNQIIINIVNYIKKYPKKFYIKMNQDQFFQVIFYKKAQNHLAEILSKIINFKSFKTNSTVKFLFKNNEIILKIKADKLYNFFSVNIKTSKHFLEIQNYSLNKSGDFITNLDSFLKILSISCSGSNPDSQLILIFNPILSTFAIKYILFCEIDNQKCVNFEANYENCKFLNPEDFDCDFEINENIIFKGKLNLEIFLINLDFITSITPQNNKDIAVMKFSDSDDSDRVKNIEYLKSDFFLLNQKVEFIENEEEMESLNDLKINANLYDMKNFFSFIKFFPSEDNILNLNFYENKSLNVEIFTKLKFSLNYFLLSKN